VVGEDREERVLAAPFEHCLGEPLVHFEGAGQLLELLARERLRRRLRDRDEGDLVGHAEHGKREPIRLLDDRRGNLGEAEAEPEPEA
jgi:hypothetical protein